MATFETALVLAGSFGLGLAHALEVDHMSAVSAFVATRPRPREAVVFGAKWAIGHGVSLLIFGSLLYAMKLVVSPSFEAVLERVVGVGLLLLGVWTLFKVRREAVHHHHHHHLVPHDDHDHDRGHSHPHSHNGALWMGLLHGIAGTAAFVGQAFVVASKSYAFVLLYTSVFSLGVLVSMSVFAGILGAFLSRAGRWVHMVMALAACLVGTLWIVGAG